MSKRARGNGGVFQVPNSRYSWISYQLNGKTVRELSNELTKTAAGNKLKDRLLAIRNANFLGPRNRRMGRGSLERPPERPLFRDASRECRHESNYRVR
jgi:hypothetical protein